MDRRVHYLPQPRLPSVAATAIPKVASKSGLLLGACEDGVQVFKDVPYSRPAVSDRRFRSPIPLRWERESDATRLGPAFYQIYAGTVRQLRPESGQWIPDCPTIPVALRPASSVGRPRENCEPTATLLESMAREYEAAG